MKKKILFVNISLVNGGAEKSLVNLLNEMPEDQYEIDLLLFRKEGMFLPQVPHYVNIIEAPEALKNLYRPVKDFNKNTITKVIGTAISKTITSNPYLMREFRWRNFYRGKITRLSKHYDVAVGCVVGECTYFVNDLVSADKKLCWVHTDYVGAKCDRRADEKYYQNMDSIVTVSDKCAEVLKTVFPEFQNKILWLPNITSSEVLRKRSKEEIPERIDEGKKLLVSVGRLIPLKGFEIAIDAAKIMKQDGCQFQWFILGNGELFDKLNAQIEDLELKDWVKLLGPKENPYAYIAKSDVVVQSSKYEGKSVVLDEAKILGIPIVSTNYDTVVDQIIPEKEGLIVNMDAEDIAHGIEEMFNNQMLYKTIKNYLNAHEYGNQADVEKYIKLIG